MAYFYSPTVIQQKIPVADITPLERLVLSHVKLSRMLADPRGDLRAWRWDLKLAPRRAQIKLPLEYTFAAVPAHP